MVHVSVVIAAHNEGKNLLRTVQSCIDSCLLLDYEIVVSDDASTDGSINDLRNTFPRVRVVASTTRAGASPTKNAGAQAARGDVLVFMDAHTAPENDAIRRLAADVDGLGEAAIVTPTIPHLDEINWVSDPSSVGHGYAMDLSTLECRWVELEDMTQLAGPYGPLYESPSLIGCSFAIPRMLYDRLWGFDPHMRFWGVEDLDLGLKCWLSGRRILHDPSISVAHRFRERFDNYTVPAEHVLANQVRMSYKNLGHSVWQDWVLRCRDRMYSNALPDHPEGVWAQAWRLFDEARPSAEPERRALHARRERDEFWYASRFELAWPSLGAQGFVGPQAAFAPSVQPSGGPSGKPPQCNVTGVTPPAVNVLTGQTTTFAAQGSKLGSVKWSAPGGQPSSGTGPTFTTRWNTSGVRQVTAGCGGTSRQSQVTVTAPQVTLSTPNAVIPLMAKRNLQATLTPASAVATRYIFEIKRKTATTWNQLAAGSAAIFAFTARLTGHMQLRVTATVNGLAVTSAPVELEIQFPTFAEITSDATTVAFTDTSWQSTLAATTPTTRREEGYWIRLDTSNGTYSHTPTILGPVVGPNQTGSVVLGARPVDNPANPTPTGPTASATYSVASFHTHTPTTFRTVGRPVGPSGADQAADNADDVVGVVYDYNDSPSGSGTIPAGHPLASPAHRYASGRPRRTTPP